MEQKYAGLDDLLCHDAQSKAYYTSLPDYVQDMMMQRGGSIQTADALHRYAENLTAGDK